MQKNNNINDPEFIYEGEVKLEDYRTTRKSSVGGWIVVVLIFVALFGLFKFLFADIKSDTKQTNQQQNVKINKNVSMKYKDAMIQVKSLAQKNHMSKKAIYEKLNVEGSSLPEDAIVYALENVPIDYKQNALEKAKELSKRMKNPTKEEIFEMLTLDDDDGWFTKQEAQYAINNL